MSEQDKGETLLTTEEAMYRLGISRGTFFSRLREHSDIKPANFNPNLKKQHNPVWRQSDVDTLGIPINPNPKTAAARSVAA